MTSTLDHGRTYQVRTYGCQMNVHDSERLAGLLEAAGYRRAPDGTDADVVVFNTCAVRENADNKLYGNISHLAPAKGRPPTQIAVGGCLAQKDRESPGQGPLGRRGVRHPQHRLASGAARARTAQPQGPGRDRRVAGEFPSALPAARESAYAAWVSISVGCNNTCVLHRAVVARPGK